jgi:hypothetical protein
MNRTPLVSVFVGLVALWGSPAQAQPAAPAAPSVQTTITAEGPTSRWIAEVGIGFDNSISGNINSGAVGQLSGHNVVILKNTYEAVYGTGLTFRFGGGYKLDDLTELIGTFTFQSLDADLVSMGDIDAARLYGQFTDYQSFALDFGFRRYTPVTNSTIRLYAQGGLGIGFVDKIDITFIAPAIGFENKNNDFYDQTVAFTLLADLGVLVPVNPHLGVFVQGGVRWVSGVGQVDSLESTTLNTINDESGRWTMPILAGVRWGF